MHNDTIDELKLSNHRGSVYAGDIEDLKRIIWLRRDSTTLFTRLMRDASFFHNSFPGLRDEIQTARMKDIFLRRDAAVARRSTVHRALAGRSAINRDAVQSSHYSSYRCSW